MYNKINGFIYIQFDNEVDFKVVILLSNFVIGVLFFVIFFLIGKDIKIFKILY